ncbi:unnamed protein product [Prunus armeniaca]
MEIIPPVGDMRYESFLDKSKYDIASSSGLVLGSFSSSTFLQGDPFLGIFRTLDLLSPLLNTLMICPKALFMGVRHCQLEVGAQK